MAPTSPVLYEVNLAVSHHIAAEFLLWLPGHIREVLECEGFTSARWWQSEESAPNESRYVVHYYLQQRQNLHDYLDHHSARLRAQAPERFQNGLRITRRVMQELPVSP